MDSTYNTTSVEISLQAALRPRLNRLVERLLGCSRGSVGRSGVLFTDVRGRCAVLGRSRSGKGIAEELGAVLPDESTKLVELGTLGDTDAVPVAEVLELRLAPGIDEFVSQGGIGSLGAGRGARELLLGAEVGEARVASHRGDQLVTSGNLGSRKSVGIQPLLEIRICCPTLVEVPLMNSDQM